jgi:formyl-CoA transferase
MAAARVPAGKVYTAKDIHEDPHFRDRGMIVRQVTRDGWSLDVPGVVPRLTETPGTLRSPAPGLGEDTEAVLRELGLDEQAIAALREKGILG